MPAKPLRRILTLQPLVALLLPFGFVVLIGLLWVLPQMRKDAEARQLQLALAVGGQVESHLEAVEALVRTAAALPRNNATQLQHQQQIDVLLNSIAIMSSLCTVNQDGSISALALNKNQLSQRDNLVNLNLSRNPHFKAISKNHKPAWSETFLSVVNGGVTVAYGVPGDTVIAIGEVDLQLLTKFLTKISTEKGLLILVIDNNGQVVADNDGRYTAQQLNIGNIPLVRSGIETNAPATGRIDFAGNSMTGSIINIPAIDWHVMVARTDSSLYQTPFNIAMVVLAGILVTLSIGLVSSLYIARKLSARFEELNTHARDVARGATSGEWPTSAVAEFNQLSGSLKIMSETLSRQDQVLRESERRLSEASRIAHVGHWDWNLQDGSLSWTDEVYRIFGYEPGGITPSFELFAGLIHEEDRKKVADAVAASQENRLPYNVEFRFYRTDTSLRHGQAIGSTLFDTNGRAMRMSGAMIDITDQKLAESERIKLEQQLLHAQKLESLGVLAGGIAHDFNNILMAIIGNADLALMTLNPESPVVGNLRNIENAAARAADLAKQMLAYSGRGKFVVEHLDLNRLLEDMLHMLEVSISKKAVLRHNLTHSLPAVEADATQMRQIIMNLVINASEAIGDRSGVIAITTGCMDCDKSYLKDVWLNENLADGLYVYLEIADTGCGMSKETMAKIFDPFFTTKFTGRGLGMAAVLGIVRGHKGAIKVYSELDKGTTFKVLLPASGRPAELFNGENHKDNWQGSGTVLLVDDEETVRAIGREMLKALGYSVLTANDGREALETFVANPAISFVIMDLTMPHMDGEQCFRELRRICPDVKVIMTSGFSEQEVTQKFSGKGLAGFVQKPYKLRVLKEAIRKL